MNLHQIFLRWLGNLLQGLATIISRYFFRNQQNMVYKKNLFCNPLYQPLCLLINIRNRFNSISGLAHPFHNFFPECYKSRRSSAYPRKEQAGDGIIPILPL